MREKKRKTVRERRKGRHTDKTGSVSGGQECWLASNWIPSIYHSPPLCPRFSSLSRLLRFGVTANKNRNGSAGRSLLPSSSPFHPPSPLCRYHRIRESDSRSGWTEFPGPFAKGAILGDPAVKPDECVGEENGVGELSAIPGHKSTCTYRIASESFLYIPCSPQVRPRAPLPSMLFLESCWLVIDTNSYTCEVIYRHSAKFQDRILYNFWNSRFFTTRMKNLFI